jgi:hypothetical protein
MTDAEIIQLLGGPRAVAGKLSISRQRVVNWCHPDRQIPPPWRPAVYRMALEHGLKLDKALFLRLPQWFLEGLAA